MLHLNRSTSYPRWRAVPTLAIISAITFIVIYLTCYAEIQVVAPFVRDWIESGKSLFIPSMPVYNVFSNLPPGFQIQFTTGHIVDIIIISFIVSSFFYIIYPYYKALQRGNDLQFLYLDKTGRLKKGNIEAPITKTLLLNNDQMILVDFKFNLDRKESRETQAKCLFERLLYSEHQEFTGKIDSKNLQNKRTMADQGHYLKNYQSLRAPRFFKSSVNEILMQRFLFSSYLLNNELTSCSSSALTNFQEKLSERGI